MTGRHRKHRHSITVEDLKKRITREIEAERFNWFVSKIRDSVPSRPDIRYVPQQVIR